jgi:hypothetical protein
LAPSTLSDARLECRCLWPTATRHSLSDRRIEFLIGINQAALASMAAIFFGDGVNTQRA